jgi:glyceraldehyde 3-phosphate dehydrogenase
MAIRVAINGFGRIGRLVLRAIVESKRNDIVVVGVNDLGPAETNAHLLRYDSVHGRFPGEVKVDDDHMIVDGHKIRVTAIKNPADLPHKELAVDIALECTGIFITKEKASAHLQAGAKRVLVSAPAGGVDLTVVYGVNHDKLTRDHVVVSNASCTTNCLVPMVKVVKDNFGFVRGSMVTVHSYTNDQNVLDLPHKDLRRARAAALSIIPTTTGAAKAAALVMPELKGKIDGIAIRVPTPDVSFTDLAVVIEKPVTVAQVNAAFKAAAAGPMSGVLQYTEEELVSSDFIGNPHSCIIDAKSTNVVDGLLLKVSGWYDNEWGYSCRCVDLLRYMGARLL